MTMVSQPDVTVNIITANTVVANNAQKVLFVGQKVAAGTSTAGGLDVAISNDAAIWEGLYGKNSQLAGMLKAARKLNKATQFDAISLDDATGTPAAGEFAISGTATAAGSLQFVVGSKLDYTFTIPVVVGATAANLGALLETAINANTDIPVTASDSTGTVTLTADNDGTIGNFIPLQFIGSVAGITCATTAFASGATDPTLTSVLDAIGDERYQTIVWPYAAGLATVKTFLDARFNITNDVQDGVAIVPIVDTYANLITAGNALNSQSLVILGDELQNTANHKGASKVEMAHIKAAQFAAERSLRLTVDANISQIVLSANGTLDAFGGPALASKPYFNTLLPNLPLTDVGKGFSRIEVEALLVAGVTVFGNNRVNNSSIVGEVVTTYKTDSAGNADGSFKFLNYIDTASTAREYFWNNLKKRFAQSRLTQGDLIRGRDMANAASIEAFLTDLYADLAELTILQSGETALQYFNDNITVTLDLLLGKATVSMVVPIVTQLRTINVSMQLAFTTEG